MIFIDTSALYALANQKDPDHESAQQILNRIFDENDTLLTHNYVLVEAISLIQSRLGLSAARFVAEESRRFRIVWVDDTLHQEALLRWANGRRTLSFVDSVSFVVMKREGIDTAFAFDSDFVAAGFNVLHSSRRP